MDVLKLIIASRVGNADERSPNSQVNRPFKFWFNSSSTLTTPSNVDDMKKVETLMQKTKDQHPAKFDFQFMSDGESFMIIEI